MKVLRFQRKRIILLLLCLLLIFILHYLANNIYLENNSDQNASCILPENIREDMIHLVKKILGALDALHVSYFLCYGSLWGALKMKGPLPWQRKFELCVLNKELSNIDEVFLVRTFKRHGLVINYNIATGAYSVLISGADDPTATLTVFEEDTITKKFRRVGWTHRLLPPNSCDILHCFPADLIEQPLEEVPFLNMNIPIPHEGIEMQKYLFPDSWWKDSRSECVQ